MRWTSTVPRWPGSTCAGTRATAPPGSARRAGGAASLGPAGACDVDLDPRLDARDAHPVWLGVEDALPHLRPALAHSVPRSQVFSLWRIRGRKRLLHAGTDLILSVQNEPHGLRACVSPALADGEACRFSIPLDGKSATCKAQTHLLLGDLPQPGSRHVSRTAVLHMRGLQALDAMQGDCGQRGAAEALFGADTVAERWHSDSDLRAQVRHILARAQSWVAGGYLQLAGARTG